MSSLHVQVNELELNHVIKRPKPAQRSLDLCRTQTAKTIAQAEVNILFAVFFKICYCNSCLKHFMILLLVSTSRTFAAMATVVFTRFSCNRSLEHFYKKKNEKNIFTFKRRSQVVAD